MLGMLVGEQVPGGCINSGGERSCVLARPQGGERDTIRYVGGVCICGHLAPTLVGGRAGQVQFVGGRRRPEGSVRQASSSPQTIFFLPWI